ncbi:MAG: NACHT domain-containing protein [Methylococcales bacterium]
MAATVSDLLQVRSLFVEGLFAYLRAVQEWPDANAPGYFGGRKVTELFVPPRVQREGESPQSVTWEEWRLRELPQLRRVLLLGQAGGGKTLGTLMIARCLAETEYHRLDEGRVSPEQMALPVYVPLPRVEKIGNLAEAVKEYLRLQWERTFPAAHHRGLEKIAPKVIGHILYNLYTERCFLFLDELDVCQEPARLRGLLNVLTHESTRCRILVGSRTDSVDRTLVRDVLGKNYAEWGIPTLESAKCSCFVEAWFKSSLDMKKTGCWNC